MIKVGRNLNLSEAPDEEGKVKLIQEILENPLLQHFKSSKEEITELNIKVSIDENKNVNLVIS